MTDNQYIPYTPTKINDNTWHVTNLAADEWSAATTLVNSEDEPVIYPTLEAAQKAATNANNLYQRMLEAEDHNPAVIAAHIEANQEHLANHRTADITAVKNMLIGTLNDLTPEDTLSLLSHLIQEADMAAITIAFRKHENNKK
jgi:hypothetical protein